jgi:hypothetical protein
VVVGTLVCSEKLSAMTQNANPEAAAPLLIQQDGISTDLGVVEFGGLQCVL